VYHVKFYESVEIEYYARQFLEDIPIERKSIPIDIELIAERDCGIEIIPVDFLKHDHNVDSWITRDLSIIYIEATFCDPRNKRYRFLIAHEIGHRQMHWDFLREINYRSVTELKEILEGIQKIDWYEHHADQFAANILIPPDQTFPDHVSEIYKESEKAAISMTENIPGKDVDSFLSSPSFWDVVISKLGDRYVTTDRSVIKRLHMEEPEKWFPNFKASNIS